MVSAFNNGGRLLRQSESSTIWKGETAVIVNTRLGNATLYVQIDFLCKCDSYGGHCDCEILFNAEERILKE